MHPLHLGSALLLGFWSLGLAIALPTQDQTSTTGSEVQALSSSIVEIVNPVDTVVLAGVPKLTPNNTCGNAGNGNNNGYTCDPRRSGGGGCCSEYVSPTDLYCHKQFTGCSHWFLYRAVAV